HGQSRQSSGIDEPAASHADGFRVQALSLVAHDVLFQVVQAENGGARAGGGAAVGATATTRGGGRGTEWVMGQPGTVSTAGCGGSMLGRHSEQSMPRVSSTAL